MCDHVGGRWVVDDGAEDWHRPANPAFNTLPAPLPPPGWFSVNVTSYPDKIHEALAASLAVLRELRASPVTARELMRAKRTLITR